jgi:hypothetical protein
MFRNPVIVLALLLGAPTLWTAFVEHQLSLDTALIRLAIAIPAAALLIGAMRMVTAGYKREHTERLKAKAAEQIAASRKPVGE